MKHKIYNKLVFIILLQSCAPTPEQTKKCNEFISNYHNPYADKTIEYEQAVKPVFKSLFLYFNQILTKDEITKVINGNFNLEDTDYKDKLSRIDKTLFKDAIKSVTPRFANINNIEKEMNEKIDAAIAEYEKNPDVCKNQKMMGDVNPASNNYLENLKKHKKDSFKSIENMVNTILPQLKTN